MKRVLFILFISFCFAACGSTKRTYITDYSHQIELTKYYFPEIYDLYCKGIVVIDAVYSEEKDGDFDIKIKYHYRN